MINMDQTIGNEHIQLAPVIGSHQLTLIHHQPFLIELLLQSVSIVIIQLFIGTLPIMGFLVKTEI